MIEKAGRLLFGFLLVPVSVGFCYSFYDQMLSIEKVHTPEIIFLSGITLYLAYHVLVGAPTRAYVLGHELMHAAAAWVSGGKVKAIKVGKKSGHVKTDKVTGFIALAPYLVPVYAILWAMLFGAASLFWNMKPWSSLFFLVLGSALTFHLAFTVIALKEKQTDLDVLGPLASMNLILLGNITFTVGVIALMIPEVKFLDYLSGGCLSTKEITLSVVNQLFGI